MEPNGGQRALLCAGEEERERERLVLSEGVRGIRAERHDERARWRERERERAEIESARERDRE